jgi:hypothetical protein
MRKNINAEKGRQEFITQCLVMVIVGLAWLFVGLASEKGYLPHSPDAAVPTLRSAIGL